VALADFVTGMFLFSLTMMTFAALTSSKLKLLNAGEWLLRGVAAAEVAVDRVRTDGLSARPEGSADAGGFRKVETFKVGGLHLGSGLVEARALRMAEGAAHQLYEVRVTVHWRDDTGPSRTQLSTVAHLPKGPQ
jgi:hypothetical protein